MFWSKLMRDSYDVVVVGGGPGGSMAAWEAAKAGLSVCLLDKDRDIARLVFKCCTIDFAKQIGCCLEDDLCRRDFRLNAIALTLGNDPQIIDPTGQDNPFDKQKEIESTFSVRFFTSKSRARAALKILAPSIWSGIV